jgi:DNA-directed RNA polymerase subunit M/transcription elongation factor TFIIS
MLRFCGTCRNLLELQTEGGKVNHVCKNCNEVKPIEADGLVYEHILKSSSTTESFLNPYLKYDPTLPHFTNIPCPNKGCSSNKAKGKLSEVVGIKIDEKALKYLYTCVHCDATWTNQ